MNFVHRDLSKGRWFRFSLAEQMGNIGSEIGRAIAWRKKRQLQLSEKSLERALELFDLTLADSRWRFRLKEIARAREVVSDALAGENFYQTSFEDLEKYFTQFALAAQKNK